jgi:hypothetical protein
MKSPPVFPINTIRRAVSHITSWPEQFSTRVRKKLAGFDHTTSTFRQRRWP